MTRYLTINRLILCCILLNTLDTVLTVLALSHGITEWNPLVAFIIQFSSAWFVFSKLLIVNGLILLVGLLGKQLQITKWGFTAVTIAYGLTFLYHLISLNHNGILFVK